LLLRLVGVAVLPVDVVLLVVSELAHAPSVILVPEPIEAANRRLGLLRLAFVVAGAAGRRLEAEGNTTGSPVFQT